METVVARTLTRNHAESAPEYEPPKTNHRSGASRMPRTPDTFAKFAMKYAMSSSAWFTARYFRFAGGDSDRNRRKSDSRMHTHEMNQ